MEIWEHGKFFCILKIFFFTDVNCTLIHWLCMKDKFLIVFFIYNYIYKF